MKSVREWTDHWNAKADIENPIEINGYCLGGQPIPAGKYFAAVVEPTIERLDLKSHHRVLDIGCGSGLALAEIEKRVAEAVGTDLSQTMIDRYKGNAKTYVCAAHELPFEDERFDRILMFSVAIYFPSFGYFREVVDNALSLLRIDGLLLIGDLNIGRAPRHSQNLWYDRNKLLRYLDETGHAYALMAQNKLKRSINKRWDVLIWKD